MQPARIKPHAKEHTNNPVQRPNFRDQEGDESVVHLYVSEVAAWHIPTCRHRVTQNLQVTVEAYSRRSIPS